MNFIQIAGHLGSDPEVRFTQSGKKVTTMRVAAKGRRGAKEGDDTIWWRVTIWGEDFEKMIPHFKKGSAIIVFGEVHKPTIFNDREGKPQVSMEVTAIHLQFSPFGRPAGTGGPEGGVSREAPVNPYVAGMPKAAASAPAPQGMAEGMGATFDDEVPF